MNELNKLRRHEFVGIRTMQMFARLFNTDIQEFALGNPVIAAA